MTSNSSVTRDPELPTVQMNVALILTSAYGIINMLRMLLTGRRYITLHDENRKLHTYTCWFYT